ncbi:transposase [Pochonia chlamydosporia 170]|uniref:Transposase n=1 Tax=Pochonia chlamydosporia 170 TaxID=1380566 RepID=A0A219AQ63_METCM|nr:transposase [Pochonia chlamydosporia 170]OWT42926.1 transposase [Pochonia chlamydosporia 170]
MQSVEARIQEAIEHLSDNPGAKVATVAKQFGVPRNRLRMRLKGGKPRTEVKPANKKLPEPEEQAICNYIDRLDRINLALQRKLNSDRQASENLERVNEYFFKLHEVIQTNGIPPEDTWNMDETGFRIGIGRDQLVVTKRKRAYYFSMPENRESATAIEAISAGGQYIPAFPILAGTLHMAQWYQQKELDPCTAIYTSASGYSNDEISLEWLKHVDRYTAKKVAGSKRLLILDGHGSHYTIEFITYLFQPLKHYHAKALDLIVRDGLVNISKLEFLAVIEGTGTVPFNPLLVLQALKERVVEKEADRTPSPPPAASSSQFLTPLTLRQINKVADRIEDTLKGSDINLSPGLTHNISRFIRGSLINATELVQGNEEYFLQSGGVLTVAGGRRMVVQREEDLLAKARRVVEAAELRAQKARKKVFSDAAKEARKWRLTGKLNPGEVYETGFQLRLLKRF